MKPSDFDLAYTSGSPAAEALGGAYLLGLKGPEAGAANPARVNPDRKVDISAGVNATASNINVNDTETLINKLNDLNNSAKNGTAATQDAFNQVYNYASGAGAVPNGKPAVLSAEAEPVIGASLGGRWAVYGESQVQTVDKLYTGTERVNGNTDQTLGAGGGAVGITSVGVPFAIPLRGATLGFTPKYIRADYIGYSIAGITTDPNAPAATDKTLPYQGSGTFDLDAGATDALMSRNRLNGAVVIRHLAAPSFNLDGYDLKLNPEFDAGLSSRIAGFDGYAELHNLSATNGGGVTDHLGLQRWIGSVLALRVGLDDGEFVYGAGLGLGWLHVDLAAGSNVDQRAGLEVNVSI